MKADKQAAIRVMTWNIHGTLGRNPRFDLARVVELIRGWDPDIVALQEVDSRRAFAGGANPFEYLAGAVGTYGIGAKSIAGADGEYGQMLISRFPVMTHTVRDISFGEREPRRAIRAEVDTPQGPLIVVATHLGLTFHERRHQAALLTELAAGAAPAVVIGDLNDWFWPGSVGGVLRGVLGAHTRFRTFPAAFPVLRLDRIYCRPAVAMVRSFVDREARALSDHLPIIADLMLPRAMQ
ncbi:MAG TPA: endonuclease/exonuclease/phosphatase family protein [Rhizomicrobium sp.]